MLAFATCHGASNTTTSQSQQEFKENAAKSQAEFEKRVQKNQAEFDERVKADQAEFEARSRQNKAAMNEQSRKNSLVAQNQQAEFDANAAKMQTDFAKKKQESEKRFAMWELFIGAFMVVAIAINLTKAIRRRKRKNRKGQISNEQAIIDAGIDGEKQTAFHLSFLPKEYTVLHNVIVRSDGLSAENDHIVIGATGIILVETKNYGGTIYVRPNGWVREKFGKREGCDSPIAQSERHKLVLESFLTKHGLERVPIYIVVAISNSQAIIEGEDPRCPVMKSENLPHWIRNLPAVITEEQTNDLRNLFISEKKMNPS